MEGNPRAASQPGHVVAEQGLQPGRRRRRCRVHQGAPPSLLGRCCLGFWLTQDEDQEHAFILACLFFHDGRTSGCSVSLILTWILFRSVEKFGIYWWRFSLFFNYSCLLFGKKLKWENNQFFLRSIVRQCSFVQGYRTQWNLQNDAY